jgi:hypothetical protein
MTTTKTDLNNGAPGPDLDILGQALKHLPQEEPPRDLAAAVLSQVKPKRVSVWSRFRQWVSAPRTYTISPLRLAPMAAVLIVALVLIGRLTITAPEQQIANTQAPKTVTIRFTFIDPQADSVALIGTFNLWSPERHIMHADKKNGVWELEVKLPAGRHEYSFLVDGRKAVPDPKAMFTKDDGFGNRNSVIIVENGSRI